MASMQEALEAAFEQHAEEPGSEPSNTLSPAPPPENLGTEGETARTPKDAEQVSEDKQPESTKSPVASPAPSTAPVPSPAPSTAPVKQLKAPVSWRPELRGKFGSLPPEIQEEVTRRERDVETGLRAAAESRRFTEEFTKVVSPYSAMLQAEGAHPLAAVQSLMNTAYTLRTAAPQQKAQLVASMIQQFGVDVGLLDTALAAAMGGGGAPGQPPQNDATLSYIQSELAPIKRFVQEIGGLRQESQRRVVESAQSELEAFAADVKNEYFEDVREEMADLLEMSAKRGAKMTLQDAYQRATMAHPTISTLIAEKAVAAQAQRRTDAAKRSRNASASLPSGGAPEQGSVKTGKSADLHSAIEAAWDATEQAGES